MANYERAFRSYIWSDVMFERLSHLEQLFYVLIHTGEESSDTSCFSFTLRKISCYLAIPTSDVKKLIQAFVDKGLVDYDFDTEEMLVLDYFSHNPPRGLKYEHYVKDFAKIKSKRLLERVAESSKRYVLTMSFVAALSDFVDDIDADDFEIKKTDETIKSIKNAAKRGRNKIEKERDEIKAFFSGDDDGDLPFC